MADKPKKRARKKRVSPGRLRDAQRVAAILAEANAVGDRAAAAKFKVGERSIRRWRARAETGEWPELAQKATELRAVVARRNEDLVVSLHKQALQALKTKVEADQATVRELIDMAVETAGIIQAARILGGDSGGPGESAGKGPASAAAGGSGAGGAGVSPLRAVG